MRSPFARWKPRHLVSSWLAYWGLLAVATLAPAALAIWKLSGSGVKGNASITAGDAGLHAIITVPGSTLWELSVPLLTVVLAIAGPPLVLWACWLLSASAPPDGAENHPTGQLGSGADLPPRHTDRVRDELQVR